MYFTEKSHPRIATFLRITHDKKEAFFLARTYHRGRHIPQPHFPSNSNILLWNLQQSNDKRVDFLPIPQNNPTTNKNRRSGEHIFFSDEWLWLAY